VNHFGNSPRFVGFRHRMWEDNKDPHIFIKNSTIDGILSELFGHHRYPTLCWGKQTNQNQNGATNTKIVNERRKWRPCGLGHGGQAAKVKKRLCFHKLISLVYLLYIIYYIYKTRALWWAALKIKNKSAQNTRKLKRENQKKHDVHIRKHWEKSRQSRYKSYWGKKRTSSI